MIIPCKSKYNLRVSIEVCIGITCKIFFFNAGTRFQVQPSNLYRHEYLFFNSLGDIFMHSWLRNNELR